MIFYYKLSIIVHSGVQAYLAGDMPHLNHVAHVSEQMHRTTQVLREVALPHLADPRPAGVALVAEIWHRVLPFLTWDNVAYYRLIEL